MTTATGSATRRRVRVLYGQHVLARYCADAKMADRYAEAVGRRLSGLTILVDDLVQGDEPPVPGEQLWDVLTP